MLIGFYPPALIVQSELMGQTPPQHALQLKQPPESNELIEYFVEHGPEAVGM